MVGVGGGGDAAGGDGVDGGVDALGVGGATERAGLGEGVAADGSAGRASPRTSSSGVDDPAGDDVANAAGRGADPVSGAPAGAAAHAPTIATTSVEAAERRSFVIVTKVVAG